MVTKTLTASLESPAHSESEDLQVARPQISVVSSVGSTWWPQPPANLMSRLLGRQFGGAIGRRLSGGLSGSKWSPRAFALLSAHPAPCVRSRTVRGYRAALRPSKTSRVHHFVLSRCSCGLESETLSQQSDHVTRAITLAPRDHSRLPTQRPSDFTHSSCSF